MKRTASTICTLCIIVHTIILQVTAFMLTVSSHTRHCHCQKGYDNAGFISVPRSASPYITCLQSTARSDNLYARQKQDIRRNQELRNQIQLQSLVAASLFLNSPQDLTLVSLQGKTTLPGPRTSAKDTPTVTCVVVSEAGSQSTFPALVVPVSVETLQKTSTPLSLIELAAAKRPRSWAVLWRWNWAAVHQGKLFDNVPWSEWSIDPLLKQVDAANNPQAEKYSMGKRDAYNKMVYGKDLGSVNMTNAADKDANKNAQDVDNSDSLDWNVLQKRLQQAQIEEIRAQLADLDASIAVVRQESTPTNLQSLEMQRQDLQDALDACMQEWGMTEANIKDDKDLDISVDSLGRPLAPYRGATGYSPQVMTKPTGLWAKLSGPSYSNPYDILTEIIEDQLNAKVVGAVLENTSLLSGTTVLGGLVILQRKTAMQTTKAAGESISVSDESQDWGNAGVTGGRVYAVECNVDEAVSMSLSCQVPLWAETSVYQQASVMVMQGPTKSSNNTDTSKSGLTVLRTVDPELSVLMEGQASNMSTTERVAPLRLARNSLSLYESIIPSPQAQMQAPTRTTPLFPTDNPVKSLNQYDSMSNEDKARTLMSSSNFVGQLPRPRVLRQDLVNSDNGGKQSVNALDLLLLPLIDESVRRQYQIRDARLRGDKDLVRQLEESKSQRQLIREQADEARLNGDYDRAERLENEARFYDSLRADVTQDEGSYSRFLDRDEWYERSRQRLVARMLKRKAEKGKK
jgi:hypothetical protein